MSRVRLECRVAALVIMIVALRQSCISVWAQTNSSISRQNVAAWLRHQEGLVRSCECRFQVVTLPTTPEMVALIRKEVSRDRLPRPLNPIVSQEFASHPNNTYLCKWWRKGAKERSEDYRIDQELDGDTYRTVQAFDGQIVRSYTPPGPENSRNIGTVQTIRNAKWDEMWHETPYGWIYECYDLPWSKIVTQATAFDAREEQRDGRSVTRVHLEHPKASLNCVLLFDDQHRLLKWEVFRPPILKDSKPNPDLSAEKTFSDYRAHAHPSGEVIWFPHEVDAATHIGRARDGTLLGGIQSRFKVLDIKFNVDIPDSLFELHIPEDAEVYDGVFGLGYLKPGDRPYSVFPEEHPWRRLLTPAIIIGALILLGLGVFLMYRKRRTRTAA